MTDDDAFRLAWRITPNAATEPAALAGSPVPYIAVIRRDVDGKPTTWPTCSRGGNPTSLAQVLDPIDPLDLADGTIHLLTRARTQEHHAQVLARTVLGMS